MLEKRRRKQEKEDRRNRMHADDEDGVIQGDSGSDDHSEPPSQYSRQSRRKNIFSKLQRRGKEAELSKSPNAGLRQEAS